MNVPQKPCALRQGQGTPIGDYILKEGMSLTPPEPTHFQFLIVRGGT